MGPEESGGDTGAAQEKGENIANKKSFGRVLINTGRYRTLSLSMFILLKSKLANDINLYFFLIFQRKLQSYQYILHVILI